MMSTATANEDDDDWGSGDEGWSGDEGEPSEDIGGFLSVAAPTPPSAASGSAPGAPALLVFDCAEASGMPNVHAACAPVARVGARVGALPATLGVPREHCLAKGLDARLLLVASAEFGPGEEARYGVGAPAALRVFQAPRDADLGALRVAGRQRPGLGWLLERRLAERFGGAAAWPVRPRPDAGAEAGAVRLLDAVRGDVELSAAEALWAVGKTRGDVSAAVALLRSQRDWRQWCAKETTSPARRHEDDDEKKEEAPGVDVLAELAPHVPRAVLRLALRRHGGDVESAAGALVDPPTLERLFAESERRSGAALGREFNEKAEHNFLLCVLDALRDIVHTCGVFCCICGAVLEVNGLKPTTCASELCHFKRVELGFGVDVSHELRASGDVVDLLITFAVAATRGARMRHVWPEMLFPGGATPENAEALATVLEQLPSIDDMRRAAADDAALKRVLGARHELCYAVLQWLLATTRGHLRKLDERERFEQLKTPHQFCLICSSPEKEAAWRERRAQAHGKTFYAFHGSPLPNWHSMLRLGLQITGDIDGIGVSGKAIWMANQFSTATGYCRKMGLVAGWRNSRFDPLFCMGVLEVVADTTKGASPSNQINVISDMALLTTRFFVMYERDMEQALPMDALALKLQVKDWGAT